MPEAEAERYLASYRQHIAEAWALEEEYEDDLFDNFDDVDNETLVA